MSAPGALETRPAALEPVDERISGPFQDDGWLASYVLRVAEGYVAYGKICRGRPDDVFECRAVAKFATPLTGSPGAALALAEAFGEHVITLALRRVPSFRR